MSPGRPVLRVIVPLLAALIVAAVAPPAVAAPPGAPGLTVKENRSHVKAVGPGFVLRLSKRGLDVRIDEERFGDPATGNPIERQTIDLTGLTLRPFECRNGTYTIRTGTFERTWRLSRLGTRPPPYPPGFAAGAPGIFTPFLGTLDGTVTDADGRTLRFLISDLVQEVLTDDGFAATAPIHGFFVDERGRVRDRISLTGYFNAGPGGQDPVYKIVDRGTCRQTADLPFGPGSENAVVTGPLFVFPFSAPVKVPREH
ncbi:hypothetical protein [Nonomuraea sp. NPDC048826]|uniref:hypothetical protein n=1 Tax=Nonomuraea sp. NPDC048826 TaxID=3364347 RepID=UPI00372215E9